MLTFGKTRVQKAYEAFLGGKKFNFDTLSQLDWLDLFRQLDDYLVDAHRTVADLEVQTGGLRRQAESLRVQLEELRTQVLG